MRRFAVISLGLLSLVWLGCNAIAGLEPGTPLCTDSSVCDDKNPCTVDTCSKDLSCVFTPLPDGKSVPQIAGNCLAEVCQRGLPTSIDDPTDVVDDGDPCTKDTCESGSPAHPTLPDGTPCTDGKTSGVCATGTCGCRNDADCDDGEPCTSDLCDPATHACHNWPLDGVVVPGTTETPGDCMAHRCLLGAATVVVDDTDAPAAPDACTVTGCNSGSPESAPAKAGAACSGPSGLCDGAGHCVECLAPTDCTGEVDQPCRKRRCLNNFCGYENEPTGFIPPGTVEPTGDCKSSVCDGVGDLVVITSAQDADDANPCTSDTCAGQTPIQTPVASGQSCGGALLCDGAGHCAGCAVDADCPGDFCRVPTCNAGVCAYTPTPAKTPLPSGQVTYDCQVLVCDGAGHTITLADDTDFAPGGCQGCSQGVSITRVDQPCSDMGQAGYCTAVGQCVQCTRDEQCPAPGPCQVATCDAMTHQCGTTPVKAGVLVPAAQQTEGDCVALVCDGNGGTMSSPLPGDVPVPTGPCVSGGCIGGMPVFTNLPAGTPCGPKTCDGQGSCL